MSSVPEWLKKWEGSKSETVSVRTPREEIFAHLQTSPEDITVVDLRNDREKGYITKAVHIPATTIDGPTDVKAKVIDAVLAAKPETKLIAIHCNSSAKRAGYVAGWLDDYLKENELDLKVEILHEGIAGWLASGHQFDAETTWLEE